MLWAALRFSDLSLQLHLRGAASCGPVVVQEAGTRPAVLSCNEAAAGAGIRPGMPVSAAHALVAGLQVRTRDPEKESKALAGIAAWAVRFTPTVSLASPNEILLEVSGCLRLFGGLRPLGSRIRAGLAELGYCATVALAPTPTGALLLARHGVDTSVPDRHALRRSLAPLRLRLLDQPAQTAALLASMGVRTLRDLWALPRDGIARRFGQGLLDETDRALGRLPDPRLPFMPPRHPASSLELPAPVQETEPLLFAAKRLVLELAGYMAMHQVGVTRLRLRLHHAHHAATPVILGLSAPSRDPAHLVTLLREKLATVKLPEAVESLTLAAAEVRPLGSRNASLLPDDAPASGERWRIIEHLRARLGNEAVHGIEAFADHRPERACRKTLPGKAVDGSCGLQRPLWLLPRPQHLQAVESPMAVKLPLALVDGPERIESGWWDGLDVRRDYFVARDSQGAKLWIYRARTPQGGWFLQGVFA